MSVPPRELLMLTDEERKLEWLPLTAQPIVKLTKHYRTETTQFPLEVPVQGIFHSVLSSKEALSGELRSPLDVAVDDDKVYVLDGCNHCIQVFSKNSNLWVCTWGSHGYRNGEFEFREKMLFFGGAIAVDARFLYVADSSKNRIQVCNKFDGKSVMSWGTDGFQDGEMCWPDGIAVDDKHVFVSDTLNQRVQVYLKDSSFVRAWGTKGEGDGQFNYPRGIAVDSKFVYVCDSDNNRVQVFTNPEGEFVRAWGNEADGGAQMDSPCGIAISSSSVFVSNVDTSFIQEFRKSDSVLVRSWGSEGSEIGQFLYPRGIAVYSGIVYVSDIDNDRVQMFN